MNPWATLAALAPLEPAKSLEARQTEWLLACLRRNRSCEYGLRHGFDAIGSVADYRRRVPVCAYEDLAPAMQRIAAGEAGILFAGLPVAFERTGGSSGGAKLIPYTEHSLDDFRRALLRWLRDTVTGHGLNQGCAYWALSPATRAAEQTAGGIPVGLPDSAYFGAGAGESFVRLSAVPLTLASETDVAAWRSETLYWLLRRADLALVSVWSPSFFSGLLDALPQLSDTLLRRLRRDDAPAAGRLQRWLDENDASVLWPELRLVSCWADASSRPYFDDLRQRLPQAAFQPKGLLSTEAVVTVPDASNRLALAADSGFYEFAAADGTACAAWELDAGEGYDVLLTTAGGLYRYWTGDRVSCTGHAGEIPILHFTGRAGQSSDLVGEKLTDEFVADCLAGLSGFRMLLALPRPAGYLLLHDGRQRIDPAGVETRLCRNPQYAYARSMGQLQPLAERAVPDALARYTEHAVSRGQRLGDIKPPALCLHAEWLAP